MKHLSLFLLLISFAGAGAASDGALPYEEFLAKNNENVSKLSLGMTKEQVLGVMKNYTTEVKSGPISNPYKSESFQRGSDTYEVHYYLTRPHQPFTPIRDSLATPVVFRNGTVTGWGQNALKGIEP